MNNDELCRKLRATPPREICEHGSQRVKCVHCENVILEARVAELESERDCLQEDVEEMTSHHAAAVDKNVELLAAEKPRPMSEAPRDGETVILAEVDRDRWEMVEWVLEANRWCRFEDEELTALGPRRWLPLPDQSGETCSNCGEQDCEPSDV